MQLPESKRKRLLLLLPYCLALPIVYWFVLQAGGIDDFNSYLWAIFLSCLSLEALKFGNRRALKQQQRA